MFPPQGGRRRDGAPGPHHWGRTCRAVGCCAARKPRRQQRRRAGAGAACRRRSTPLRTPRVRLARVRPAPYRTGLCETSVGVCSQRRGSHRYHRSARRARWCSTAGYAERTGNAEGTANTARDGHSRVVSCRETRVGEPALGCGHHRGPAADGLSCAVCARSSGQSLSAPSSCLSRAC